MSVMVAYGTSTVPDGPATVVLAIGEARDGVDVQVDGPASLVFTQCTIQPGGSTGWHTHPGPVLVAVQSGTLTRYDADGSIHLHHPGNSIVEPAGADNIHMGANDESEPVVLIVTYVVPAGAPLRIDCCPPALREPA